MEKILGNFLTQPNRDFPLDAETLDYLQQLCAISGIVGNIAGNKVVLCGCEPNSEKSQRSAGWVFIRTSQYPDGEILHWEGGSTSSGMYLDQEPVGVTVSSIAYNQAYTKRSLKPGYGSEHYDWDDFTDVKTLKEIAQENKTIKEQLKTIQPAPIGSIILWAGSTVPEGYMLCKGQELSTASYPELYKILGTAFNTAMSHDGRTYTTTAGNFRVPDLQGRFVVGQHDLDNDYKTKGACGGAKAIALKEDEIPTHKHNFKDYYHADSSKVAKGNYDIIDTNGKAGCGKSDTDNTYFQYYKHDTDVAGGGQYHENRPPYYVLAYIIRYK